MMKMRYRYLFFLIGSFLLLQSLFSQETLYYLQEDFEGGESRSLWTSIPLDNTIKWKYEAGGDNDVPPYAYEGVLNAVFYWSSITGETFRTLVSPPVDLSNASKPQLIFAHAQFPAFSSQDELRVLFKAGDGAAWDTVEIFDAATPDIVDYELRFLNIDEYGAKYLCEGFQVGFLGVARGGNGICIDSVLIEEKDYIPKFIETSDFQSVGHSVAPTGIKGFPILRNYLYVFGNTNQKVLNSISFQSNSTNDTDFDNLGFNLYRTRTSIYRNQKNGESTKVAGPVSISNGSVTFSGLGDTLATGDNYYWLTVDVNEAAAHNDTIDFYVPANGVVFSDTTLPSADVSPTGKHIIKESVFFDNFESLASWTFSGTNDFEIDAPQGFSINDAKDPDYAYSGTKILGTDLTDDGGYLTGVTSATSYFAVTPVLNLKYYKDIALYAQKWLSFNPNDDITIDISTDGGASWESIWERKNDLIGYNETGWSEFYLSDKLNNAAKQQESFQLRLAMNTTHASFVLGGWNLDDFAIVGNLLETDVGITQVISPYDDCLGNFNDTVKIIVKNHANMPTPDKIPVFYSLDGLNGTKIYDTIDGPIGVDDSVVFSFDQIADFQQPGAYNFLVSTDLSGDEDYTNNAVFKNVFIQKNLNMPYYEDFEEEGGYWVPRDSSRWECIIPSGAVPELTESPHSWFVSPIGYYFNNDTSWIVSSCYDLFGEDFLVVDLMYWNDSEFGVDGANLQYSLDNGESWLTITNTSFGDYSGWYSDTVSILNDIGWSGNSNGWKNARELLPADIISSPQTKFRFYWSSDSTVNYLGFVFNDFSIYPAPPDVGVSSIQTPVDACQYSNEGSVSLYVKNYGVNKLHTGDTIIVGINLDSDPAIFDSVQLTEELLPGDSVLLNFDVGMDIKTAKTYSIYAYTLIEDEPYFYSLASNDTAYVSFTVWPSPVTELPDTISSREPKNVVVRPYETVPPGYTFLWYDGATTDTHMVDKSDKYYTVTVTEPVHSCMTDDSVYVLLLFNDVGADSVLSPVSGCELSDSAIVKVRVRNFGTDSLFVNDEIVVYYSVNGGASYCDTIVLQEALGPNAIIEHPFSEEPYDFSSLSSYVIQSWAFYAGDTVNTNDSSSKEIVQYGYPDITLGNDTSISALSHTLDAGAGYSAYLWNTSDTTQSIKINTSGDYWVRVQTEYGCQAYDTVSIWFSIRDLLAYDIVTPIDGCYSGSAEGISVSVLNNGTDTLLSTDSFEINYRIGGGDIVTEVVNFAQDILPGQYGEIGFDSLAILAEGTNTIDFWVNIAGDLRADNDSLSFDIDRATTPVVDFGADRVILSLNEILDAGSGANYTYLWQDGATQQTYAAIATGNYYCQVTDENTGCFSSDTVFLDFDYTDFAISTVGLGNNECEGVINDVQVVLLNKSSNPKNNASLTIGFSINGSDTTIENITVPSLWFPNTTVNVTLSSAFDLTTLGNNTVSVFIVGSGDLNRDNDIITKIVDVKSAPFIDFGGDTLYVQFPYTLDAGSGFTTYQWQDNTTNRYYNVQAPGLYKVAVSNTFNCVTVESVVVLGLTAIPKHKMDGLSVLYYPNPVKGVLYLDVEFQYFTGIKIEIIDVNSKSIWCDMKERTTSYQQQIDLHGVLPGVYFLRISGSNFYWIEKLVVE